MIRAFFVVLGTCSLVVASPYCDAPPEVQAELLRAGALWDRPGPRKAFVDDRNAILEALVKKVPNDIQAFRRYLIDSEIGKSAMIEQYKARLDASPADPLSIYFYAQTLVGRDTPQAIRLLERSLEEDPELAWAHNALARASSPRRRTTPARRKIVVTSSRASSPRHNARLSSSSVSAPASASRWPLARCAIA